MLLAIAVIVSTLGVTGAASADEERQRPIVTPGQIKGFGFDTCAAPNAREMRTWGLQSPFRVIGIYISGSQRGCNQPNLTRSWVRKQWNDGWRFLPLQVPLQAPCTTVPKSSMSTSPSRAAVQGRIAGRAMVRDANRLGISKPSTLYLDMEWWDLRNRSCTKPTMRFIDRWIRTVRSNGYRAGVYSSASAAIAAMDRLRSRKARWFKQPDERWIAWGNGRPNVDGGEWLADHVAPHQRVHQYILNVNRTFGGKRIYIDYNFLRTGGKVVAPKPALPCGRLNFGNYPELHVGDRGAAVKAAKCLMKLKGNWNGPVDAAYGRAFAKAVKRYQPQHAISDVGWIGGRTWTSLLSRPATPILKWGATGQVVYRVQRALTAVLNRPVPQTGFYGIKTMQAVADYRRRLGMKTVNGITTPFIWRKLSEGRYGNRKLRSLPYHPWQLLSCDVCTDPDGLGGGVPR